LFGCSLDRSKIAGAPIVFQKEFAVRNDDDAAALAFRHIVKRDLPWVNPGSLIALSARWL
jgi:hypothetical protein